MKQCKLMDINNNLKKVFLHLYLDDFGCLSLTASAYVQWTELPSSVRALWDDGYTGYVTVDLNDGTLHYGEVPLELMNYFNRPINELYDEN